MQAVRRLQVALAAAIAIGVFSGVLIGDDKESHRGRKTHRPTSTAFLGIAVEDVPPSLVSHLGGLVPEGQGVLVVAVGKDSPSEKAGIHVHDVLLTYDDQKLVTAEQLIKLVRHDKPNREVKLSLVRGGKPESVMLTLGERTVTSPLGTAVPTEPSTQRRPWFWGWLPRSNHRVERIPTEWNNFDSMTIRKLDADRYHASIKHTDKNGKMQTHEFEGTRDEIHKKIESDEDMTPQERAHLLRSLDLGIGIEPLWLVPDGYEIDF